jgi:ABC-2 type transport system permease protein
MSKVLTVAKYEYRNTVRKKTFLFMALFIPLAIALPVYLSTTLLQNNMNGPKAGFVDDSGLLQPDNDFIRYSDTAHAKEALLKGDIGSFLTLAPDYLSSGSVTLYSSGSTPFALSAGNGKLNLFLEKNVLRYANVDANISKRVVQPSVIQAVSLDKNGNPKTGGNDIGKYILPYALSILLVMSIITSSNLLMQGIGEEKESRTGELLLSSISAGQLLKGKILGYGAVGITQIMIWIAMAFAVLSTGQYHALLAGIQLSWVMGLAALYFLLGYALYSVSIACAAAISPTAKEAQQTSSIFMLMAALPLAFSQIILMAPDSVLAKALTLFPYTAPVITMMRISLTDVPLIEIMESLALLAASILLVMSLAAKIFRMGMLLQGKRASLKEVIGFIKEK